MPKYLLLLLFFITFQSFSQKNITGVIADTLNKPLESANVIAKPLQEKAGIKFAMADNKGRYKLELEQDVKYEIMVSYIGFTEEILIVEANSSITTHNLSSRQPAKTSRKSSSNTSSNPSSSRRTP